MDVVVDYEEGELSEESRCSLYCLTLIFYIVIQDTSMGVNTAPSLHFVSPSPISAASVTSSLPGTSTTPLGAGRGNLLAKRKWLGCSPLDDFDIMEKVGEGTFGYVSFFPPKEWYANGI